MWTCVCVCVWKILELLSLPSLKLENLARLADKQVLEFCLVHLNLNNSGNKNQEPCPGISWGSGGKN